MKGPVAWQREISILCIASMLAAIVAGPAGAMRPGGADKIHLKGPVNDYYALDVAPHPFGPGEKLQLVLYPRLKISKATAVFGWFRGNYRAPFEYKHGAWRAELAVPPHAPPGDHLIFVYLQTEREDRPVWEKIARAFKGKSDPPEYIIGKVWAAVEIPEPELAEAEDAPELPTEFVQMPPTLPADSPSESPTESSDTSGEFRVIETGKRPTDLTALSIGDLPELNITGSKIINFTSKSLEGSREGFSTGTTREETLRLNIAGKLVEDIEVDANILNTSTLGSAITGDRQDKVNVHLKRRELAADMGDIDLNLSDVEFAKIVKRTSGMQVEGQYPNIGFTAFSATPQGQAKLFKSYGNGTTGPFRLGNSPVVVDSERVYLDGVLKRRGEDYTIDYNAGTITFRTQPIIDTQIIETTYDHRFTSHPHQTLGGRVSGKPLPGVSMGITYIDDSDNPDIAALQQAEASGAASAPAAQTHHVVGLDGSVLLGDFGILSGEAAQSQRNPDMLNDGSLQIGRAGKIALQAGMGPASVRGHFRRITPLFLPISDPNAKSDLTEHAVTLGYRPWDPFQLEGGYTSQRYLQSGSPFNIETRLGRAKWTPGGWPTLSMTVSDAQESTDPVSASPIGRFTNKRDLESSYRLPFGQWTMGGGEERREDQEPVAATTTYRTARTGLTFLDIDPFTLSGNVELKETELPDGTKPLTRTYTSNISVSPSREYVLAGSIHQIDDTLRGPSGATEINYRAEPAGWFRTDGKWTISSVSEQLASTQDAGPDPVNKQIGSLNLELRPPVWGARIKYFYRPEFTNAETLGARLLDNNTNQVDVQLSPFGSVAFGFSHKINQNQSIDPSDYPQLDRVRSAGIATTNIYSVKLAPIRIMSVELTYTLNDAIDDKLKPETVSLPTPGYTHSDSDVVTLDAVARTSISEAFSLDGRFTNEKSSKASDQVSAEDRLRRTGSLKVLWNLNSNWTVQGGSALTQTTDYLLADNRDTFLISPTAGWSFRDGNKLRIDFDYSFSRSTYGVPQENSTYGIRAKYELLDAVSFNFRGEHQEGVLPHFFRSNDFAGSVEIKL